MRTHRRTSGLVLIVLAAVVLSGGPFEARDHQASNPPRVSCAELLHLQWPLTQVMSADLIPAQGATPEFCRVLATVAPQTDIEVRLPSYWKRRILHLGGAGFDGAIPNLNSNAADLRRGSVLAGSNGGHRAADFPLATFGVDPELTELYAHKAIDTTIKLAKALIEAYYGRRANYSYFAGCSNGGRGAFNAAAKYAKEYDGVVAAAPTRNMPGLVSEWTRNATLLAPTPAKLTSLFNAAVRACDHLDGLEDGIVSNPAACDFDPAAIRCSTGTSTDACLTDQEVATVHALSSDLQLSNGRTVHSRFGFGNLAPWLQFHGVLGVNTMRYIVLQDPTWNPATFDLDADYPALVDVLERRYDFSGDTRSLAKYLKSGRKMIVWHGSDDTLLSHLDTIRSYNTMTRAAGPAAHNARLYAPPGVGHCGGGPGADSFDMIHAITEWVERGKAPRSLVASKVDASGQVLFTRPLCEYPKYPRYVGFGDLNDAASFRCRRPDREDDDR